MKWGSRGAGALVVCLLAACAQPQGLPPEQRDAAACRAVIAYGAAPAATVRWTLPRDSAERAVLDAWCAGVGPAAWFAPGEAGARADAVGASGARALPHAHAGPDTGSDPDLDAGPVVVVAWNYAMGGGDIRRFLGDLRAGVHTGGQPVERFVLLLQEAPRIGGVVPRAESLPPGVRVASVDPVPGPDVLELAREQRLHLLYAPSMREGVGNGMRVDHGTAILSSLPLAEPHVIEMPAGIQRRAATAARVAGVGAPLHVVSVHLDNFAFRHFLGSFGGVRARQAQVLAPALPRPDGARALVVGGDLNTWTFGTRERAFRILRARLPRPAELQPEATARRLGVPRRLDYLLLDAPAGWTFTERRIADAYGSDHHALIAVLQPPGGRPLR
jgi:endonuclease/exonuclease/phosphatase family metal-dependent hydrolase